ncbi:MAG: hypothetical protein LUF90_05545 [Rikenellaceae bacterium]|nr:hypothetical protein [Rikenellaceae bacterium]
MKIFTKLLLSALLLCTCVAVSAQIGTRLPSEKFNYEDTVTGLTVKVLTNSPEFSDGRIYQTHPQWTYDDKYVAFRSRRTGSGQLFFVNEETGVIVQITDGPGNGDYNLSRKKRTALFFQERAGRAFKDYRT